METFSWLNPLYSFSGLAVGMIVGLTGVGGGSLMTPLLVLLFGVHPSTAVGTDLLYAASTKAAGTALHGWGGKIDWGIVSTLAAGSVPAAVITVYGLSLVGIESHATSQIMTIVLGIMLIATALTVAMRHRLLTYVIKQREVAPRYRTILTVVFGAAIGVLVSISSVGAGAIGVTVLMVLYPRMHVVRIVASDIAHAVPLTLVAGVGHWVIGSVDWPLLGSLLVGSIPGVIVGSLLTSKVNPRFLRYGLAIVLMVVGVRMLFA